MAFPENRLSSINLPTPMLAPRDVLPAIGESLHIGGIALNDPSLGLQVQTWRAFVQNNNEVWLSAPNHPASLLFADGAAISHVSLAFDANMNWAVGFVADGQPKFRWFDTVPGAFVTTVLNIADSKPMLVLDDTRRVPLLLGTPDIIVTYIRASSLYHRLQRDRFSVEYLTKVVSASQVGNFGMGAKNRLQWDLGDGDTLFLSKIVRDASLRTGQLQHDVDDLATTPVRGYIVAGQFSAADAIRQLQTAYFFDAPDYDDKIRYRLRGGDPVATITLDDMVEGEVQVIETAREQGLEFPLKLHVNYASAETDYNPTKATSERLSPNILVTSEISMDLAVNFTAAEAAQIADKAHKVAWADQEGKIKFGLPEKWLALIPSDIVMVETRPGRFRRARIETINDVDGVRNIEAVIDRKSAYGSASEGVTPFPATPPPPSLVGLTTMLAFNLPRLREQDAGAGMYVLARGDAPGWRGAEIQLSLDGGVTFDPVAEVTIAGEFGSLSAVLPIAGDTLSVTVPADVALENATAAQITAGANAFAIAAPLGAVAELGQFNTATEVTPGAWNLTGLTRGGLGTTAVQHEIGEDFAMLGTAVYVPIDSSFAGQTLKFRAVSLGSDPTTAAILNVLYQPVSRVVIVDGGGDP